MKTETLTKPEQLVLIQFYYNFDELEPLHQLEMKLDRIISENNLGSYDGHEVPLNGPGESTLFMNAYNAEMLFKAIKPTLESVEFMRTANVLLRFGSLHENASEIEIPLI